MKLNIKTCLAASMMALIAMPLHADEVTDQIGAALEAYEAKSYKDAMTELKFAITQIQQIADKENAVLLPEPLDGWTAEEISNDSAAMAMIGGGTSMTRKYHRGDESLEIQIVANSPGLNFMLMAVNNPMMMAADPTMKPYKYNRIRGIKRVNGSELEVTLSLAGQVMIKLLGENLEDESVITNYLDAMDMQKVEDALL